MASKPRKVETVSTDNIGILSRTAMNESRVAQILTKAHTLYNSAKYKEALDCCEQAYEADAFRTDNLLLMGAIHFQMRNYSESIFYNQQCIRVDPNFAEGYSNLGNALKELGDLKASIQFYHKVISWYCWYAAVIVEPSVQAIKLKPRFSDAYNNLASTYMQLGQTQEAMEAYQMALVRFPAISCQFILFQILHRWSIYPQVLNPGLVDAHSNLGNLYKVSSAVMSFNVILLKMNGENIFNSMSQHEMILPWKIQYCFNPSSIQIR